MIGHSPPPFFLFLKTLDQTLRERKPLIKTLGGGLHHLTSRPATHASATCSTAARARLVGPVGAGEGRPPPARRPGARARARLGGGGDPARGR